AAAPAPPGASAASRQCTAPGVGKGAIVDIAKRRHALDQRLNGRRMDFRPAPFAQLSTEVGGQLRAGRRIASGIEKRGLLKASRVEWRLHASATIMPHRHVCAIVDTDY